MKNKLRAFLAVSLFTTALLPLVSSGQQVVKKPLKSVEPSATKLNNRTPQQPSSDIVPNVPTQASALEGQLQIAPAQVLERPLKDPLPVGFTAETRREGLPTFIRGVLANSSATTSNARITEYLSALSGAMNIKNPGVEFAIKSTETDEIGQTHTRMTQKFDGLKVLGSEIIVHEVAGKIRSLNGSYFPTPALQTTRPVVAQTGAETLVQTDLSKKKGGWNVLSAENLPLVGGQQMKSELVVFHKEDKAKNACLAWHVVAYPSVLHRWEYVLNAQTGEILESFRSSCDFFGFYGEKHDHSEACGGEIAETENTELKPFDLVDGPFTATATDLLGVNRTINTYQVGTRYHMIDASRTMFNLSASRMPSTPVGAISTLDYQNSDSGPYVQVTSTNNAWNNPTAVSAHYNGALSYDYFKTKFNRNSINGTGGTILSFINVTDNRQSMENAYWNGEAMFYGNGGSVFRPLARGLDVGGHEMSHGVIQNTANLRYQNESGALNESFADIFGAMIDRDDWQMGEDVVRDRATFSTGFLRDLSNPNNGGTSLQTQGWQPKKYSERYTGTQDNGGVHINSGIPNYAFYLFATNASVGKDRAERVFYRALSQYLVASSRFIDLRAAVESACRDLYSNEPAVLTAAQSAFTTVEIGSGGSSGGTVYQQNVPVNPGSDHLIYVSNDKTKMYYSQVPGTPRLITQRGIKNRPSVTDDGVNVVYVGTDRRIYIATINYTTNTVNDRQLQGDPVWNNVAISRDGRKLAGNEGDSIIWVYSFQLAQWKSFPLRNPTSAQGNITTGEVKQCDAMEFDHFGEYVMYDAFNEIAGSTANDAIEYWDVGFINVWNNRSGNFATGQIQKLFNSLPEGASIGNPTFAENSPHIIAFDYIETDLFSTSNYILAKNIQSNAVTQNSTGIFENNTLGVPSFSRLDNSLVFNRKNGSNTLELYNIALASSKIEPSGTAQRLITDAQFGVLYGNGTRVLTKTQEALGADAVKITPNPFNQELSVELKSENAGAGKLEVFNVLGKNIHEETLEIQAGQNALRLDTKAWISGSYFLKITIDGKSRTSKLVKI
jgi:bacillolysin